MKLDRKKLLALRCAASRRWTQEETARRAGITPPTYNRAEAGDEILYLTAQGIADAFEVAIEELQIPDFPAPLSSEAEREAIAALKHQERE